MERSSVHKMSKKSLQSREQNNANKISAYIFAKQKQVMKKAYIDYFAVTIMFFAMALLVFIVGLNTEDAVHSKQILFGAVPLILIITFIFAFFFLRCLLIFNKLRKAANTTEENRIIVCKKIAFLFYPVSKFTSAIISIVFTDENGEKYYYVITDDVSSDSKKDIRKELYGSEVLLVCYKNTNLIKDYNIR